MRMQRRVLETMIPSVDLTCTTERHVHVSANAPLLLSDRDDTIFILAGHVDVFAVRVKEDKITGPVIHFIAPPPVKSSSDRTPARRTSSWRSALMAPRSSMPSRTKILFASRTNT